MMGAYVCPSCGEPLITIEDDLKSLPGYRGVGGHCTNQKVCGVENVTIIINRKVDEAE